MNSFRNDCRSICVTYWRQHFRAPYLLLTHNNHHFSSDPCHCYFRLVVAHTHSNIYLLHHYHYFPFTPFGLRCHCKMLSVSIPLYLDRGWRASKAKNIIVFLATISMLYTVHLSLWIQYVLLLGRWCGSSKCGRTIDWAKTGGRGTESVEHSAKIGYSVAKIRVSIKFRVSWPSAKSTENQDSVCSF